MRPVECDGMSDKTEAQENLDASLDGGDVDLAGAIGSLLPRPKMPEAGTPAGIGPDDLAARIGQSGPVLVTCTDYSSQQYEQSELDRPEQLCEFLARHRPSWSSVRWIDVRGLKNVAVIRAMAEKYELHPLAVEDVLNPQRPKCEDYPATAEHPERLFVIAVTVRRGEQRHRKEQVALFLGRHTLLTFQPGPEDVFKPIRSRLAVNGSAARRTDASFLSYMLLDVLVDYLFPVLDRISLRLERLERHMLRGSPRDIVRDVYLIRQRLMLLRRATWPMREMIHQLHREPHECLSDETRTYLRDVHDHIVQIVELTETYREFAQGLAENYNAAIAHRTNDVMKVLTIISTIFVPLTFLAGVYGMNLKIPEAESQYAYPLFWLVSIGCSAGMLLMFRRRGWF